MKSESLPSKLGLIAGEGSFPFLVLDEAEKRGIEMVTLGIEGAAAPELETASKGEFHWLALGAVSRCVKLLRNAGVSGAIMAGRVRHVKAFQILKPDRLMLRVLGRLRSRETDAMLKTLADVLSEEGVELLDSTLLLDSLLAREGAMTSKAPSKESIEDLRFGLLRARGIAALDVGQTVVVKRKAVVAVEAMEGTDDAIRRAGRLVDGPLAVVKVARPSQDFRFDVPVVGPKTIDVMDEAGATALGLEATRVLLLERDELLERAERLRVAVFGLES